MRIVQELNRAEFQLPIDHFETGIGEKRFGFRAGGTPDEKRLESRAGNELRGDEQGRNGVARDYRAAETLELRGS